MSWGTGWDTADRSYTSGEQGTTAIATDAFRRQFGIRSEWRSLAFHCNRRLQSAHLKTAMEIIEQYESTQLEAYREGIQSLSRRIMGDAPVPAGALSIGELPSEVQERLLNYLRRHYDATPADLTELVLVPQVSITIPLKGFLLSMPLENFLNAHIRRIPAQGGG